MALDALEPNPFQPRLAIDPARLAELAASIRESGDRAADPGAPPRRALPDHRGRAALARGAGRRPRDRAGHRARGAATSSCWSSRSSRTSSARSCRRSRRRRPSSGCRTELGLTQEEIARRVGRDRTTVANTLRLLRLPRELRELLAAGPARRRPRARAARARAGRGPARARPRGRAQGPLRARGRAARGARCARRAGAPPTRKEPNTARRRGAAARARSARASRSRAAARAARSACRSRARPSCSGSTSCCCARGREPLDPRRRRARLSSHAQAQGPAVRGPERLPGRGHRVLRASCASATCCASTGASRAGSSPTTR